jgi:hypothetical protein
MSGLDPLLSGLERSVMTPLIASLKSRHHRAWIIVRSEDQFRGKESGSYGGG